MKAPLVMIGCVLLCAGCEREVETSFPNNPNVPRDVLSVFGEPLLPGYAAEKTNHIYRFTCLRSFDEPFCVVLTVKPDGAGSYSKKIATGADRHPEVLNAKTEGTLAPPQVEVFLSVVDQERFWSLDEAGPPETGRLDGSTWIVEAVRDGRYHIVNRRSPGPDKPLGKIGRSLLQVTDSNIKHVY